MPSWIKEKDGIVWFDEPYTIKQTNQSIEQLAAKAKAKKIRRFKQRNGGYWYAKEDVDALREAYLKRSSAAKGRKPTDEQLEARHTRKWQRQLENDRKIRTNATGSLGPGYVNGVRGHLERVMLYDIERANAERKKRGELNDDSKDG